MSPRERLVVQELRPRHVLPLVEIAQEAFATEQETFGADKARLRRQARLMAVLYPLQRRLPKPMTVALVGSVDGVPVGVVIADPRKQAWYINTVMVAREHRQRGYARALVEAVCKCAAEAGAERALLHMREDNHPAYGLYSGLGFVPFERVHQMLLKEPREVEPSPLPDGHTLEPRRRRDRRTLAVLDACREPGTAQIHGPSRFPGLLQRSLSALSPPKDRARLAVAREGSWVGLWTYIQESPVEAARVAVQLLPEHRDKGLERPLLERAIARAAGAGVDRLATGVGATNAALLLTCQELGFHTRFVFVGMARAPR